MGGVGGAALDLDWQQLAIPLRAPCLMPSPLQLSNWNTATPAPSSVGGPSGGGEGGGGKEGVDVALQTSMEAMEEVEGEVSTRTHACIHTYIHTYIQYSHCMLSRLLPV